MALPFDPAELMNYFNYVVLAILALGVLGGFLAGMFKSIYKLIVFVVLLLIGWFLSPYIVSYLLAFDISSIYPLEFDGLQVTSINDFLVSFVTKQYPDFVPLLEEGTQSYTLVIQLISMVLRLVVVIVWLILMGTIFKFLFWIVYLFIKPRRRTAEGKRMKKTMGSRFGGALVGALRALIAVVLLSIPLSGIASIGANLASFMTDASQEASKGEYVLYLSNDAARLANGSNMPFDDATMEALVSFMQNYRQSYAGMAAGLIKIKEVPLDEYAFDELLSITVNETQVKFRYELIQGLKIYDTLMENTDGEINVETFMAMDKDAIEEIFAAAKELKIIQVVIPVGLEVVTKTNILGDQLEGVSEYVDINSLAEQLMEVDFLKEIENIGSIVADVSTLKIFESDLEGLALYMSFDTETVSNIFNSIGDLQLVDIIGNVGIAYLLASEELATALDEMGLTTDDIDLSDVDWGDEIANLGNVYAAFKDFDITSTEFEQIDFNLITDEEINAFAEALFASKVLSNNSAVLVHVGLSLMPEEYRDFITVTNVEAKDLVSLLGLGKVLIASGILNEDFDPVNLLTSGNIDALAEYISSSNLLSGSIGGIIEMLLSQVELPEGLTITIDPNFDWSGESGKTELKALLKAAGKLVEMGIGEDDFIKNLSGDDINELADILAESTILMSNIQNILEFFLSDETLTGGIKIELGDIDWTSAEGKTEFKALLGAVSAIFAAGILEDGFDFKTLEQATIDDLAAKLAASTVIRNNLTTIINQLVSGMDIDFTINAFEDPDDWTELELKSLLSAVKIVLSKTNIPEDLFNLSEAELNTLLGSHLICDAIINVIKDFTAEGGQLHGLLIIKNVSDDEWKDTLDDDGNVVVKGELRKLFTSAKILLGENINFDDPDGIIDPNRILNLSDGTKDTNNDGVVDELDDDEIKEMLTSKILKDTIINKLIEFGTDEKDELGNVITEAVLVVSLGPDDVRWEAEIKAFVRAVKVVLGESIDLNNINVDPDVLLDLSNERGGADDDVGVIMSSTIITDTIIKKIIDLAEGENSSIVINLTQEDDRWYDSETEDGEIRKLIRAIQIIFSGEGKSLNNPDIDPNVILNLSDGSVDPSDDQIGDILASIIASDSMIKVIYDLGQGDDSALVINLTLTDERWYDTELSDGELKRFIRAVKIILGENPDLSNVNVDPDILLDLSNHRGGADDDVGVIMSSTIVTDTIIKEIIDLGSAENSSIVVNLTREDERWYDKETEDGEIRRLIRAIQILFSGEGKSLNNPDIDPNVILNLSDGSVDPSDDQIGDILASIIASDSMIKVIYDLGQGDDPVLIINLTVNDARWYDDGDTRGELRHFIEAVKVILGENPNLNNPNVDANVLKTLSLGDVDPADDDVKTIQKSIIARDTIINKIIEIAHPTEGEATLVVNLEADDPRWLDSETEDGEIRKLIRAIQIIFKDPEDDINNPNIGPNIVLELTNGTEDTNDDGVVDEHDSDELGLVLQSTIISDSIIKQLRELGSGDNPTLIVDLEADDPRWHDSEERNGEIRNLVLAIEIILVKDVDGNIDLDNPTIRPQDEILRLPDPDIDILMQSIILTRTIVKEVMANETLTIPEALKDRNNPDWYNEGDTRGELHKLFAVAAITMDDDSTQMSSTKFLNMSEDDINIVLASLIATETIKTELRGMDKLVIDETNPLFKWEDSFDGDERTDGELRKLLTSATLLVENEEIKIDKILTLSHVQLDQLCQSRIIVDSTVKELETMTAETGSLYKVLYLPDKAETEYHGSGGELKRFLIALQYLKNANTTPDQGIADMKTISIASLTDEHQGEILASAIISNTIITNIVTEANRDASPLVLPAKFVEDDPAYDESAWEGELPKFLDTVAVFLGEDADLSHMNISAENFTNLTDGTVDLNENGVIDKEEDEIKTITSSDIIAYTIVQEIIKESTREGSILKIPNDVTDEVWYGNDGELRKFLMAVSAITGNGLEVDENKFLNLSDNEITRIVNSRVLSYSIVKKLEDERHSETTLITLPNKFNPDQAEYNENLWYGESGELAKTLKALRGLGMTTYDSNFSIRPLFDEAKGTKEEVILASEVVEATIINKIETEAEVGGSLHGTLIIPPDITWERTFVNKEITDIGELRRFLKAIDIILDGGELESASFNVEKFFDDGSGSQATLLASRIIEASVVAKIDKEASEGGSLYGTLVYPSDWNDEDWYGPTGELPKFLDAIEIIIGGGSFETTNFEADKFLGDDRPTLLASRVIEASVVDYIIDSANPVNGVLKETLYLPNGLETNNPQWYSLNGNEINRFLDAIKIIVGPGGSYAEANFSVDAILGDKRDEVLESRVVEASVVRYVIESSEEGGTLHGTLVIPVDLQSNGEPWYGPSGELKKFLDAMDILIGEGTYGDADFSVDAILGPNQDTLLESRVVEASVIKQVKLLGNITIPDKTIPAHVAKYYYFSDEDIIWERTYSDGLVTDIGELRRFLAGVDEILGVGESFATFVFNMNAMMTTDFAIVLESRVLEATVADMVDDILATSLNGFIKTPADGYQWFYHATSTDLASGLVRRGEYVLTETSFQYSDLLGFLNSIQAMEAAGLDFENITYMAIAACDSDELSTALWDYSRIMRGSIATMLNKTLEPIGSPFKPIFKDSDFNSKADVKTKLDEFKFFVNSIS